MVTADLPVPIDTLLRAVTWRQTLFSTVTMMLRMAVVSGFAVLVWLVADAWLNLPSWVRAMGPWAAVIAAIVACVRDVRFQQRERKKDLTRRIEQAYPDLQERLSTCRDLAGSPLPSTRTERWFHAQLRHETLSQLDQIDPARVVSDRKLQRALALAALMLAGGFLLPVWWGDGSWNLAARWLSPWDNHGWGAATRIITTPRDHLALRNRDFLIEAQTARYRPWHTPLTELTLCWREQGESTWHERPLDLQDNGRFSGHIPHVSRDVVWFVRGRGAESPRTTTRVIDPPQVTAMTAWIDAPGYTGQASEQLSVLQDLSVLAGSQIRFAVQWDQPLQSAELHWPDEPQVTTPHSFVIDPNGTAGVVTVRANESGPFTLRMTTRTGLTVEEPARALIVRPDQPPVAQTFGPATLAIRPDERHAVHARANDDFGLSRAELQIDIAGQTPSERQFAPWKSTPLSRELSTTVDLLPWKLAPGASVTLRVRVFDNREQPGPQEGWSAPQVLVVSSSALPEEVRQLTESARQAREDLAKILRDLETERGTLRDIHQKTAAATVREKPPGQETRLQELTAAHQELQDSLREWTATLPDDEPGEAIRQEAERILNGPLADADQKLAKTPQMSPRDQIPTLSQALDDLAAARSALKKVDDALIARAALGDDLLALRQLANQSERTAEALQMEADASSVQEASDSVQQIQQELARIVQRRPEWQAAMDEAQREQRAATQTPSALAPQNVDAPKSKPSAAGPVPLAAGQELLTAKEQLQQSQNELMPNRSDPAPAAQSLQAAADAFRDAIAQTAGKPIAQAESEPPDETDMTVVAQQPGQTGVTDNAGESPLSLPPGKVIGGKSQRNWGRLPTGLQTEILQGSRHKGHPDYAAQVQRYFERIAQPVSTPSPEAMP